MGQKVTDIKNWEEIAEDIMRESELKDPKFKQWIMERECLGEKFFGGAMWRRCYMIWKSITKEDRDHVIIISAIEGGGKSTIGMQVGSVINPKFTLHNLLYTPERLPKVIKDSQPGDVIILDEGNMFLFSREAMSGGNKLMVKLFALVRMKNLVLIINVPNFWTVDSYLREHRVKTFIDIPKTRGKFKVYSGKAIKLISKYGTTMKSAEDVKVPRENVFKCWNSSALPKTINEEEYRAKKLDHFNVFLDELEQGLQAMAKPGDDMNRLITVQEAAEITGLHQRTIQKYIIEGKIRGNKIGGRRLVYKDDFLESLELKFNAAPKGTYEYSKEERFAGPRIKGAIPRSTSND